MLARMSIVLVLLLAGCPKPAPGPVPPSAPDAGVVGARCDDVCVHFRELGCKEGGSREVLGGKPLGTVSQEGRTCTEVCEAVQSSGLVSWDLSCRAAITACSQVDACER